MVFNQKLNMSLLVITLKNLQHNGACKYEKLKKCKSSVGWI